MITLIFFYQILPALFIVGYLIATSQTTDGDDKQIPDDSSDTNTEEIEWEDLF